MSTFLSRRAALVTVLLIVSGLLVMPALPATANEPPKQPVSWLAAGDSYSSGEGISGAGVGDSADPDVTCARSDLAYGPKAASILGSQRGWNVQPLEFTACTGSTLHEFFGGGKTANHSTGPQWPAALARAKRYDVVSMSFGGNDIGFADILTGCLERYAGQSADSWQGLIGSAAQIAQTFGVLGRPGHACNVAFDDGSKDPKTLKNRIDNLMAGTSLTVKGGFGSRGRKDTYAAFLEEVVRQTLSLRGTLVLVGYPRLFAPSSQWAYWRGGVCNFATSTDADVLGQAANYFDTKLREAVDAANTQIGNRIEYVSRYDEFHADNTSHELCSDNNEYLNGLTVGFWDGSARVMHSFHPNNVGHQVTAEDVAGDVAIAFPAPAAPPPLATEPRPSDSTSAPITPIGDGTSHWDKGDSFSANCVVAWPTAPAYTTTKIVMTMSCQGVPQQFTFVNVSYPDPNLPITPNTGTVQVQGKIVDFETSTFGFREIVVNASKISWPDHR